MQFEKYVKIRPEKFGAVIFETLSEKVFVTNQTGAQILQLLEEGREPDEIITFLLEDYEADREVLQKDIEEFVSELKNNRLIKSE